MSDSRKASSPWKTHLRAIQISIPFKVITVYKVSHTTVYAVNNFTHKSLVAPISSSSSYTQTPLIVINFVFRLDFHPYNLYSLTPFYLKSYRKHCYMGSIESSLNTYRPKLYLLHFPFPKLSRYSFHPFLQYFFFNSSPSCLLFCFSFFFF